MPIERADWSGLSLAVGLALAEALDPAREGQAPRVGLKWPNDLWLLDGPNSGRKLGGVLIETVAAGAKRLAVIGVGLNVRPMQTTEVGTGFACLQEMDPQVEAPAVLHRLALPLVEAIRRFEAEGFAGFAAGYARRDLLLGQPVRTTQQGLAEGVAQGVDASGALQVHTTAGLVAVTSGEVSVRLGADGLAGG